MNDDEADPAIEAAERVTQPRGIPWAVGPGRYALHGAREALAPIRDLHRPSDDECRCCKHCIECGEIGTGWPCDTAKLVYTDRELEARQ